MAAGMAESTFAAVTFPEVLHNIEFNLDYRDENHLGDALADLNREWLPAAVPAGDEYLTLVVGVD